VKVASFFGLRVDHVALEHTYKRIQWAVGKILGILTSIYCQLVSTISGYYVIILGLYLRCRQTRGGSLCIFPKIFHL